MKYFDKAEKALVEFVENEKWIYVDNLEVEIQKARKAAYATVAKTERMNIRLDMILPNG